MELRADMISAFNELFTETFVWSYSEYTDRVQEQLAAKSENKDITQIMKIVILVLICAFLFIFLVKI